MKLSAFLGSPRADGNTDIITSHVIEGAGEVGTDCLSFALRSLKIHPCIGCERCWERDRPCIFDDGTTALYRAISESDVLVFATPVYWYGPTATMKAFIDRLVVFNRPQGRPLIQDKGAILVMAYEEEGPAAAEPLIKMFRMSFDYLGLRLIDQIVVDGVGPKGAVLLRPDALRRAHDVGRSLTQQQ